MKRTGALLAVILLAIGTSARAGEMDKEYGNKGKASPDAPAAVVPASPGSELDRESPSQAWFYGPRRGFFGFGLGFGFGYPGFGYGFGYPGLFGYGYPGFGFGGLGFGGFYGGGFGGFYGRGFGWGGYGRGYGWGGYGRGFGWGGHGFHRGRW